MAFQRVKKVTISNVVNDEEVSIDLTYVTGFKEDEDVTSNTTSTFDGVVTEGSPANPYSIEIDRISYEGESTYFQIKALIDSFRTNPGTITSFENIYPKSEAPFCIMRQYHDCILDGKSYEINPEQMTAHNLKFKAGSMDEAPTELIS